MGHAKSDSQAAGCPRAQLVGLSSAVVQILALLFSTSDLGHMTSFLPQFPPGRVLSEACLVKKGVAELAHLLSSV